MRQHLADVRKIADSSEPATFDNTIVAMERSGETLTRVSRIFFGLVQADTNDARQKIQEEVAPKLAAHQDEINLDPKLFARVKSIYDQRDTLELDPVQKRLVEHYYDGLVRAGAQLSDADKASLRKLNVEENPRRAWRCQRHPADRAAPGPAACAEGQAAWLRHLRRLPAGRPDGQDPGCRAEAADRHRAGRYRQGARRSRRDPEGDRRAEGRLPGRRLGLGFYAEQVRKAKYDLDESQIKPYFELDNVLQNGVFYAATQLYGITFKPRTDIPTYNPDMKVYEVFDKDGTSLALFYTDYFKRDSKSGGAWMDVFVEQDGLTGAKPVVYNVCNFTKPAAGQPALISFDDVTTMFHEFGHALHGMFSNVKYPSIAGTATSRDFVEFPSQFNEHWALDPKVFANYAKHYKTGEAMPQELVDKILKARSFNQGYATTEYLSAALLDLAWHTQKADAPLQDVGAFEASALKKFKVDLPQVPPRYRTTYFDHIWGGGYSAGYYAYFWAEVLDHDAYQWFTEHGGLTAANGQEFRDKILSRGNSVELSTLYRDSAARTRRWNRC